MPPKRRTRKAAPSKVSLTPKQKKSLDIIEKKLQCSQCTELLDQPYHLNCDHCVCEACLKVLLQEDSKCPECKTAFSATSVHPDPIFANLTTTFKEISSREGSTKIEAVADSNTPETSLSVFTLKKEIKTQSPIDSPRKPSKKSPEKEVKKSPSKLMKLSDGLSVEIVNDSSNDAFTYLCTHPAPQAKSSSSETQARSTQEARSGDGRDVRDVKDVKEIKETKEQKEQKEQKEEKQRKSRKRGNASSARQEADNMAGFDISDYIIITSSLSRSALDHIRQFAARYHVLWMQEFPHQARLLDASCPQQHLAAVEVKEDVGKGKKARQAAQRYIVVIRDKDGWCKRTVKYLYGLACGAWIVSMKWVENNLASPQFIPPHAYELKGDTKTNVENAPRVSRIAHEKGLPGLFNGVFFFIRVQDTKDGIPLNILIDLIQRCGCVRDMEDMTYRGKSMRIMEVVDRLTSKSDLNTVTVDWVLNCIGSWKLL